MRKAEYLEMLMQDVETESPDIKAIYHDVIDCVWLALTEVSDDYEVDDKICVAELYEMIEKTAKETKKNCVGPFEAAEIFAQRYGVRFVRPSRRAYKPAKELVRIEDFI